MMTDQTATNKNHFELIFEKTTVCPCEMEATFKAFFKADETEFDGHGFLNMKNNDVWAIATDSQIDQFISNYKK